MIWTGRFRSSSDTLPVSNMGASLATATMWLSCRYISAGQIGDQARVQGDGQQGVDGLPAFTVVGHRQFHVVALKCSREAGQQLRGQ